MEKQLRICMVVYVLMFLSLVFIAANSRYAILLEPEISVGQFTVKIIVGSVVWLVMGVICLCIIEKVTAGVPEMFKAFKMSTAFRSAFMVCCGILYASLYKEIGINIISLAISLYIVMLAVGDHKTIKTALSKKEES